MRVQCCLYKPTVFRRERLVIKEKVKREDIKYNFLKNIVIRFDFDGMDDSELDVVVRKISPEMKERGYNERTFEISKKMDINLQDPETVEYDGLTVKNVRQQKVFTFHNIDPQVKLKLSSSYAFISINKTKYVNCLDYCNILLYVMKVIKENVTYFSCRRFGLRKINQCYLMDIKQLGHYFKEKHYKLYSFGEDSMPKVMQLKDSLFIKNYNVNLIRTITCGEIDGEEAYQINFDSDIYLLGNEDGMKVIENDGEAAAMNEVLFALYKDVVTEAFIKELIDGTFNSEIIRGIESND